MTRNISCRLALFVLIAAPSLASAAIIYSKFSHPTGDYILEYPSHWRRSLGLQAVYLHPWGKLGPNALISLERYPLGKGSPQTPADFEKDVRKDVGIIKKLLSEGTIEISGVKARRLALMMSADVRKRGKGDMGPYREVMLILPTRGEFFYVLKLAGVGQGFEKAQPEFEKIAKRLKMADAGHIEKK
ncbi:MAG: hypothetical protein HY078_16790 [Elusimicrobia bacterium]|nr:hypothetical protein [Elusimicrobiota bacterium]